MWCASCGSHLAPGARFCGSCGTAVQQDTGGFQAGPRVKIAADGALPPLSEAWSQLKLWRLKMVLAPIQDQATARTLVVVGAFAFAANAAFSLVTALENPFALASGVLDVGLAAALWYANSRVAAAFGIFSLVCAMGLSAVSGAWANPLVLAQLAAMGAAVIGAARGAFALHAAPQSAPSPSTQTGLS